MNFLEHRGVPEHDRDRLLPKAEMEEMLRNHLAKPPDTRGRNMRNKRDAA